MKGAEGLKGDALRLIWLKGGLWGERGGGREWAGWRTAPGDQ